MNRPAETKIEKARALVAQEARETIEKLTSYAEALEAFDDDEYQEEADNVEGAIETLKKAEAYLEAVYDE